MSVEEPSTSFSKCHTIVALLFSFMKFHECLRFPVFSQILIMKQQCKKLWIVSEVDVKKVFWFGLGWWFFFFLKGEEMEDLL